MFPLWPWEILALWVFTPFYHVIEEITNKVTAGKGYYIQASVLKALQEICKAFLINEFKSKLSIYLS